MDRCTTRPGRFTHTWLHILAVILGICASFAFADAASAEENGVIHGSVINQTTGQPATGVDVTLSRFDDPANPRSVDTTTTTDEQGGYAFTNVDTADGFAYVVSVRFNDVLYSSGMLLLSREPEQKVDLAVYETTTDQSAIQVSTRGIIVTGVDDERGILSVTDVLALEVDGDRTIVAGDDGRTLRFTIPDNALEVAPGPGFDLGSASMEQSTILATAPVKPDGANVSLNYTVPYTGESLDLQFTADYPTGAIRILVPANVTESDLTLASSASQLLDLGVVPIDGRDYHVWSTTALPSGEGVNVSLSGLPSPAIEGNRLHTVQPAIVAFVALAAAAGLAFWTIRKRDLHLPQPDALVPATTVPLDMQQAELVSELRLLEAEHGEGRVDDDTYAVERRSILEELRRISRQSRGAVDD